VAIGRAVKAATAHAGRTQAELSTEADIGLNSLSRRLNGHVPFTFPELVRVCHVLGIPLADLTERAERIAASLSA